MNEHELLLVDKDEDSLWFIEQILKTRAIQEKKQYFVKWEGFAKSFNQWIDASQVREK